MRFFRWLATLILRFIDWLTGTDGHAGEAVAGDLTIKSEETNTMGTFFTNKPYPYSSVWRDKNGRETTVDAKTPGVLTANLAQTSVPSEDGTSGEVTFTEVGDFEATLTVDADMTDGVRSVTAVATGSVVEEGPGEAETGELVLTGNVPA